MPSSAVVSTSVERAGQRGRRRSGPRSGVGLLVGRGRVEAHRPRRLGVRRAHRVDAAAVGRDLHVGVGERRRPVSRVNSPLATSSRNTGARPSSSATSTSAEPSGVHTSALARPVVPVAGQVADGPVGRASTTREPAVARVVRRGALLRARRATDCPSGLKLRAVVLASRRRRAATRRSPRRHVDRAPGRRAVRPRSGTRQVVATVEPSGLTSYSASTSARARLRGQVGQLELRLVAGRSASASVPAKSRGAPGPRSWSQNRTGHPLVQDRRDLLLLALLALRASSSSSLVRATGTSARRARRCRRRPRPRRGRRRPARSATTRASPPPAGSSQSSATSSSSSSAVRVGTGGGEQQRAVGQERRPALALGAAGQPPRRSLARRVDLPERGDPLRALRVRASARRSPAGVPSGDRVSPAPRGRST